MPHGLHARLCLDAFLILINSITKLSSCIDSDDYTKFGLDASQSILILFAKLHVHIRSSILAQYTVYIAHCVCVCVCVCVCDVMGSGSLWHRGHPRLILHRVGPEFKCL